MNFENRVVLVTGARTGIGLGIATAFARAGAEVAMASRNSHELQQSIEDLQSQGYKACGFSVEVQNRASVTALIENVAARFGGIDILCTNAGIYPYASLREMTEEQWDEVLNVNARGAFFCIQAALPWLAKSGSGRIVLTSSITGPITGIPGLTHYGASKAAQLGFMRSAVMELAKENITINAVLPGVIATEALKGLGESFIRSAEALVPVGRLGTPEDIANAVLFFAAEKSSFITGQTLVIDGGQILPETPDSL
jgi:3-oxoacyl-[acyl-carrier protein] reductase